MKIFKNRGDIYISKTDFKQDREQRILLTLLAVVIIITVVFFVLLGHKYDSAKAFFGDGEVSTTVEVKNDVQRLPEISGKRNFLIFEMDEEESVIHYIFLLQADRDNKAYKVCSLSPKMQINGKSLYDIYSLGGGASLQTQLTAYLGINIDYYASFKRDDFIELVNKLGKFEYNSPFDLRYNDETKNDTYAIRLTKGAMNVDGADLSGIIRYYINQKEDYDNANQIILYGLTGVFNLENYEDSDALFKLFINSTSTNITVRNFQDNKDAMYVFCNLGAKTKVYSVVASYDKTKTMTSKSVSDIKGYFSE